MTCLHITDTYVIKSFANGGYFTIENYRTGESVIFQGDDAIIFEKELDSATSYGHTNDTKHIDILCNNYL